MVRHLEKSFLHPSSRRQRRLLTANGFDGAIRLLIWLHSNVVPNSPIVAFTCVKQANNIARSPSLQPQLFQNAITVLNVLQVRVTQQFKHTFGLGRVVAMPIELSNPNFLLMDMRLTKLGVIFEYVQILAVRE